MSLLRLANMKKQLEIYSLSAPTPTILEIIVELTALVVLEETKLKKLYIGLRISNNQNLRIL